ncbi:MAG: NADH-quinone oxidoreductase subunit C [Nitrospiraceae bacterium]|nr:NADH-quinone oxidoreductase subunit C [Nitrospiraceae bacterium]
MEPLEIAEKVKDKFPNEVSNISEFRGQATVTLNKDKITEICRYLNDAPDLYFNYLVDLCGVDYLGKRNTRFEIVYHLYSLKHRHMIRLKTPIAQSELYTDSVVSVWIGADWYERECFDMYGIFFNGHKDMRRILMPDDWEGYPLRKDYPVKGHEKDWSGFLDVLSRAKRFKNFEWHK